MTMPLTEAEVAKFWALVEIGEPDACWEWMGGRNPKGYGVFRPKGKRFIASRAALAIKLGGEIPQGTLACHSCDNPPCCNPAHLWPGTNADNILDASSKGRLRNNRVAACPKGHPYSGRNLVIVKGNQRCCLRCKMDMNNAWRRRKRREKANAG